jgi:hypothetical protein
MIKYFRIVMYTSYLRFEMTLYDEGECAQSESALSHIAQQSLALEQANRTVKAYCAFKGIVAPV